MEWIDAPEKGDLLPLIRIVQIVLEQLEDENARLKKIVADLSLDKEMLQDVLKKITDH